MINANKAMLSAINNFQKPTPERPTETHCQAGHAFHETEEVAIHLGGEPSVPSFPAIPDDLSVDFRLKVFRHSLYENFSGGYCSGKSEVSKSIAEQGIWEGYETSLILNVLKDGDQTGLVLDFGANIGYYSILAGVLGYEVMAFEADSENIRVLSENASINEIKNITPVHCWVDLNAPILPASEEIALMKCDLEGNDRFAIAMCRDLFKQRRIGAAVIEISPCFNDDYFPLTKFISDCGYDVYCIPDKGFEFREEFERNPLATVINRCQIQKSEFARVIKNLWQANFLFLRS